MDAKRIKAQQGGTFGGFLVGLLLGLVIAVGVALFVAKSPIPFIDKVSKPLERAPGAKSIADAPDPKISKFPRSRVARREDAKADSPATEQDEEANKEAPAASEASRAADSRRAAADAKRAEALLNDPKAGDARPEERKGESRASGEAKSSGPVAGAEPKQPGTAAGANYVQAGAFKVLSDAEALKARLALLGLESRVVKSESAGAFMYRVRLGPFYRSDEINRARNRLIEAGVDAVIVKQP
ncbi:MAG: SPOR domain-containing protein [Burkholderiaceae bacterium]